MLPQGYWTFSNILQHRLHKVSWTSQSELFEELKGVLEGFLLRNGTNLDQQIVDQIENILKAIDNNKDID